MKMLNSKMDELTREAVLKAMEEFDELRQDGFLSKYKFGPAKKWFIHHQGRRYDAKAIAGVAHRHLGSGSSYLNGKDFHTGKGSKALEKLRNLGFVLGGRDARAVDIAPEDASSEPCNSMNFEDHRPTVLRAIKERRGQQKFREKLLQAYENRCAISSCSIVDVLESAHIYPYGDSGPDSNIVNNGILLRADLHTLFDCGLIAIDSETRKVRISPQLHESEYERFQDQDLNLPLQKWCRPSLKALKKREEKLPLK